MPGETLLKLGDLVLPVGSARGIAVEVAPIAHGELVRDVNGDALWLGRSTHRRYALAVSCTDMATPPLAELWPGDELEVSWPTPLRMNGNGTAEITLTRDPVEGSVRGYVYGPSGISVLSPSSVDGREVTFASAPDLIEWRPVMDMIVVENTATHAEWQAEEGWSLQLEEV